MAGFFEIPPVLALRRSFRAKLLLTLLSSVSLLATITLVVVRVETSRATQRAAEQAEERSRLAFVELEARNGEQLSQLATVFTGSVQAVASLEGALEAQDPEVLRQEVAYELQNRQIPGDRVVAFTDDEGEPFLAMVEGRALAGDDPAGVRATARRILFAGEDHVRGYRLIEANLYNVETVLLELVRPVGTVTLGVPIGATEMERLGNVIGAEVCFVVDGRCVVGTARADVEAAMLRVLGGPDGRIAEVEGERWSFLSGPFNPEDSTALWVIGLPLAGVEAPFHRVERAVLATAFLSLLLAGLVATVLSRSLTRPVRSLVAATERVGIGDYEARVDVKTIDEIGVLGRAFNEMTEGLALKERYRGLLDKVVSKDIAEELLKGEVKLGGENREVSVLFADITGFTTITDGLEPPAVIALLNECMGRLTGVVEREGGVVDKYVGDQIMALFGAPVTRGQDALRAVRAARGMQHEMEELNGERARRGEAALEISIGINTGQVMAGNMGSPSRLNYTVLGDNVNLASRVEHEAPSAGVLITERTYAQVADHVRVRDVGLVPLRGFANPVQLYQLLEVLDAPDPGARKSRGPAAFGAALLAALVLSAGLARAEAQVLGELPTLERLYLTSASGAYQLVFSGRLDLEGYLPQDDPAWIIPSTSPFAAPRLRLFVDAFLRERVQIGAELRVDRGEEPRAGDIEVRIDQAFLRLTPLAGVALQAGRFVSPFAGYAQRHHTQADPFIRPPLTYDHRTVLEPFRGPSSGSALLTWKDNPAEHRPNGMPVVWGTPYQWGALVSLGMGRVSARAALMNSTPSSGPAQWGLERGFGTPALVVSVGAQLSPAFRLEASHSRGAWMEEGAGGLPPTRSFDEFDQRIWSGEAVFAYARTKLRGEVFYDSWEVPNVPDEPTDISWYLEGEQDVAAGFSLAVRYGRIDFSSLEAGPGQPGYGTGEASQWDYDVGRLQLGAAYRVARNAGVRVEATLNDTAGPRRVRNNLGALQLWWEF